VRIAFVCISRFPCAVEAQRQPALARQPLIVGDAEEPRRVFDCSLQAGKAGVRQGMAIRQALSHCPEAVIVAPDLVLYRSKWEAILEELGSVSPEVEDEELGRAYLNIAGLETHYESDAALAAHVIETARFASGLDASVGLAGGKLPAFAAATACLPGESRVVPRGGEAAFLAPLDVDLLPVEPEIAFRLHLFGLDRIGDVAALTLPELQSQFGFAGKRLWQLANGVDEEPLRPRDRSQVLQGTMSLDTSVAGIDVMIAIARQILSRLKLSLKGRAVRRLTLEAELESGRGWQHDLVFREPVSEDDRLAFLLRSALTHFPPPQAIRSLTLRLTDLTGETGKQLTLGGKHRQQRQLEEAIRQLKTRYGYSPIYRCVDVEPWSLIPEERQILVESDA
jgi:nucleotidyltransferase/DNA polymerase involved in DNA repair